MDLRLSDEQTLLRDTVRRYLARDYLKTDAAGDLRSGANWTAFAEMGLLGVAIPAGHGNFGGPLEAAILMRELGRAGSIEPVLECAVHAASILARCDGERAMEHLADISAGREIIVAAAGGAIGERGASGGMEATELHDGILLLEGISTRIPAGGSATSLLVEVQLRRHGAEPTPALVVIPLHVDGVETVRYTSLDGRSGADLRCSSVRLPHDSLVAHGAAALAAQTHGGAVAIACACSESVGCISALIDLTSAHLSQRRQFNRPLAEFQVLQHAVAEMFSRTHFAESMLFEALGSLDRPVPERDRSVSATKVLVDQTSRFVAGQAVHLHGGMGMSQDYPVGQIFRRLLQLRHQFGGESYHLGRYVRLPLTMA